MFKIEWDKEEVERKIHEKEGDVGFLDFWTPIHIYVNDVDISGLDEVPRGDVTQFFDIFVNILFIFKYIDPERLGEKSFSFGSNIENIVYGGGFNFYVFYTKQTDSLTIQYINFVHKEDRFLEIPLKDFAEGVLRSTKEVLEEVGEIDPKYRNDVYYTSLKEDMETIRDWYMERFGENPFDEN